MKPLGRMIALLASVAHLLATCSNATVNHSESASKDAASNAANASTEQLAKSASVSPQLVNDWPPDTPDLRDVIFEFTVTGEKKRVLSDDGSGFLVIQSAETSEAAKLVFFDDTRALYHIPKGSFEVIAVGPDFLCQDIIFKVLGEKEHEIIFDVSVHGGKGFAGEGAAAIRLTGRQGPYKECYTLSAWEKANAGQAKPSGAKVALAVVGLIVLLPAAILLGASGLGTYETK